MGFPSRGDNDDYVPGSWNAVCFRCGFKRKANQLMRQWQGYWVCPEHWEARHPQDFVRTPPDQMAAPWTQPRPGDYFIPVCTLEGITGGPGYGMPGCMMPGYISPAYPLTPYITANTNAIPAEAIPGNALPNNAT